MNRPALTAARLDALLTKGPDHTGRRSSLATESLWGASAIAKFMGVSDDFVRKCAQSKTSPIRRIEGRYFCTKTEITAWLISGSEELPR